MPVFHAIVALSENGVISDRGKLPWHLPEEYRWFKHKTIGGTLIMGRKTREAIGRALPRRTNLVLSRTTVAMPDTKCYASMDELLTDLPSDLTVWVVGGAEIYRLLLPRCTLLYLTRVKRTVTGDVFFPPFEHLFTRHQVIYENADFRVESWVRGENSVPLEDWPVSSEANSVALPEK